MVLELKFDRKKAVKDIKKDEGDKEESKNEPEKEAESQNN